MRHPPALTVLALLLALVAGAAGAETRHVSTARELQAGIAGMEGGEIVLAPGDYGDLTIEKRRAGDTLTLRAEPPRQARFGEIRISGSDNLAFLGLHTTGQFRAEKSAGLTLRDCLATDMLYFRDVEGLEIGNCRVSGGQYGLLLNTVQKFALRHSWLGHVTGDVMRITGDSHDGLLEGNILSDTLARKPKHPDLLQMFAARGKGPRAITIRRNLFHDDPATGNVAAQGVFMAGPQGAGYSDMRVEENLFSVTSPNTIYVHGGQRNVVVRGNTLIANAGDGGAIIRLTGRKAQFDNSGTVVEGNVAKLLRDESRRSRIGPNYFYGRDARPDRLFSGPGARWQDYLPVIGTAIDRDNLGATGFVKDLLAAQKPGARASAARLGPNWTK